MEFGNLNIHIFRMINDLGKEHPILNPGMVAIAEYTLYALLVGIVLFWFTRKGQYRTMVICGFATVILAEVFGKIAGKLHSNNQPFAELTNVNQLIEKAVNNSFPSDHTIIFFSFCVTFCFFQRRFAILWFILASLVGISRIWVGVHYPADVLVGMIVSVVSAVMVYRFLPNSAVTKSILSFFERADNRFLPTKSKSEEF